MLGEALATAVRDGRMSRDALRHLVLQPRGDSASQAYFQLADWLATHV
jgi:hypothetical protein